MKNFKTLALLSAVLFARAIPAFAESAAKPYVPPTPVYVATADVSAISLPAAPADGSEQDRRDFAILHDWQDKRTEADCSRAKAEAASGYDSFFGDMSPFPKPLPAEAVAFFKRVRSDAGYSTWYFKKLYARKRPFLRDTTLKPCLPLEDGYAYPSGHTMLSRLFALVLSDLVPGHKFDYIARADQIALDRVVGGVHHPSDTDAGKLLADDVHALQLKDAAYIADLELMRRLLSISPTVESAPAK